MERRTNKRRKAEREMARFTAFACVAVMTSGLLLSGCAGPGGKENVEEKDTSILVETALPKTESIELDGDFIGTVEAEDEITVVAKIGGDVTAAYFEEGDRVNAGDLLFTIDDRSAQISMEQAQASLESANASVNSASAGVSVAELNLLYTQEQIKETLGKVDTNQMQLENAVASAKYALKAAEENESIAAEQFGIARDNYKDLEDSLDDLKDDANNMGKYARQLKTVKSNYDKIKNGTMDLPSDLASKYTGSGTSEDKAAYYIKELADAESEYELGVMISSAESSESSMRSQRSSLDGNKDSARLAQIQAAIGKETAKNNVLSAEDAKRLAEKMLQDYELYTKAVIIAGANAQLAGSNSNLIAAQSGMTQAQAGVKQAQAGVEAAQLQLEYTQVTAPVSGVIREKNVTVNNMAMQGSTAYVITADSGSNVTFYVSEAVMKELTVGQQAKVERNGETYQATISENAGVADAESGLFKIKAQLSESDAQKLIAGTTVKITLATRRADQVMTIPVDSVYYEAQKAFVYCMEGNKAVKTEIETGITNNETVEVKSGLTKDSQIITTWASQLKDGAEVKLRDAETKDDSSNDNNIEETAAEEAADETAAQ
jgi:RND family efflux transporter MFP subunit